MTEILSSGDEESALEWLHANGRTDGLPVVIPTKRRVDRMVLATGLDPALSLGAMGPGNGDATIETIATNAVMAGCIPDHAPVVVAALQAMLQPEFDLSEMQSTTHNTAPLTIVGGPVVQQLGLSGGFGALGPGHRANAAIGRAIRLAMMNIGGARPGESDMALLGHPGKFSFCVAEDAAASPWEPVHTTFGHGPADSSVIVLGTEAPHSCVFVDDADSPESPTRLLRLLAATVANLGSNNAWFRRGTVAIALNGEHAATLGAAGISRRDAQEAIAEHAVNRRGRMRELNPAFAGRGDDDDLVSAIARPDDVVMFVAGGAGLYSSVFPSWAAGAHANPAVTERVLTDLACEIPA